MNRSSFYTFFVAILLGCTFLLRVQAVPPTPPKGKRWIKNSAMSDEFNRESNIFQKKWVPRAFPAGATTWLGRQPGFFNPANIKVNGKFLTLQARKQQPSQVAQPLRKQLEDHNAKARREKKWDEVYKDFSTAYIRTTKTQRFGYFEINCKMAKSKISSNFWLRQVNSNWKTEIDVFEYGHTTTVQGRDMTKTMSMNHHVQKFGGSMSGKKPRSGKAVNYDTKRDLTKGFNTYGVEVTNTHVRWYFNNKRVREIRNDAYKQPMHVVIDRETYPNWLGLPKNLNNPDVFQVNWVRVWQLK